MTSAPENLNALTHAVIGAAIEVHCEIGPGFLEAVYEEALAIELGMRNIPFSRQVPVSINYKGHPVGEGRLDLLVNQCLILELKAVENLLPIHSAQVISYLKATHCPMGLLMNFNVPVLTNGIKRLILK